MKKDKQVNVRLSDEHLKTLQQLVDEGIAKSVSGALVYLVQLQAILGSKK
ncbi:TPA: hypothetical protein RG707_001801 [Serratia liquefaciens]|nr:hypothetical protein [Serratia liquefaciens]HDU8662014.1 hypothetical protein [Serratia liquefaciens]